MAVQEVIDYIENGNITHSVNYPDCNMGVCTGAARIAILHKKHQEHDWSVFICIR